jgi:hypothetical protein
MMVKWGRHIIEVPGAPCRFFVDGRLLSIRFRSIAAEAEHLAVDYHGLLSEV